MGNQLTKVYRPWFKYDPTNDEIYACFDEAEKELLSNYTMLGKWRRNKEFFFEDDPILHWKIVFWQEKEIEVEE